MVSVEQLAQHLRSEREAGRTIVQCHGCFDIVHPGHVRYLQFARQLGDVLVVSLTGDSNISKGPDRPYIPQELRAENLAALEFVDWVVVDPHPTACELLEALKPSVYVKGREYAASSDPRFLREAEIVERHGGRVVFHSGDVVFSSTRLIQSLERDTHLDEVRLRTLCQRGDLDSASVSAMLARFDRLRVVVIGDVYLDEYVVCDAGATAMDAPMICAQRLGVRSYWGGAAAIAAQAAALGAAVTLICNSASLSEQQHETAPQLASRGVVVEALSRSSAVPARMTVVVDDAKLLRITDAPPAPLDSAAQREALRGALAAVAGADLLIWSDEGYGFITPGLVREVCDAAGECATRIVSAVNGSRADPTVLMHSHLAVLTERRLRELSNDMNSGLPVVAWSLLQRTAGRAALVQLAKRGWLTFHGRGESPDQPLADRLRSDYVPGLAVHHADTLGVIDAAAAIAGLALAAGASESVSAYFAAAMEALTTIRQGRWIVSMTEFESWLATRPELRRESHFMPDVATISDIARVAPPLAAV